MRIIKLLYYCLFLIFFAFPCFIMAQDCIPLGITKFADDCSAITCCEEGICVPVENTALFGDPTVKCFAKPGEGQECSDTVPCPYNSKSTCTYFKVEDDASSIIRSKCISQTDQAILNQGNLCNSNDECLQGTFCVKNDTTLTEVTTENKTGTCWNQTKIDTYAPSPQKKTHSDTIDDQEQLKQFEQSKPALSIPIPTITQFSDISAEGEEGARYLDIPWIYEYITGVYKYGLTMAIALAILMIMIGGGIRIISGATPQNVKTSNSFIFGPLMGLVILFSSYLLLTIINPEILTRKSINLPLVEPEFLEISFQEIDPPIVDISGIPKTGPLNVRDFKQYDKKWAYLPFDGKECQPSASEVDKYKGAQKGSTIPYRSIASSGCSATTFASIMSFYNKPFDPSTMAKYFVEHNARKCGSNGVSPGEALKSLESEYNMEFYRTSDIEKAINELKDGHPVGFNCKKCNVIGSDETTKYYAGHFFTLSGFIDDEHVAIADPGWNKSSKMKINELANGKSFWIIKPK